MTKPNSALQAGGDETPVARILPRPGSPEASAMMDTLLAEYNWPSNTKNCARAGWEAAHRWLATRPTPAAAAGVPTITDEMALAFHRATTDGSIGASEVEDIKIGLRAAFIALASPVAPAGVPTDEQILRLASGFTGLEHASPFDLVKFARAVLSAGAPAVPLQDEQDSDSSHLAVPGSTAPSATSRGQAVGNGDGAPTQPERSPRELSDAALIDAFIAHNEQFSRSSDHPAWLHCKDGDGNSTSLRGDLFAAALRNLLTGEQA